MLWLLFALGSAICVGITSVVAKSVLKKNDAYLVAFGQFLFAAPFLFPILLYSGIPELTSAFWTAMIFLAPLEVAAIILFMKSISASPVSLSMPFLAFTPAFMLLTGFLILGELPGLYGILGILLIVTGAYILNIKNKRQGLFAPFKAILDEKGSVLMLIVAVIYSITSVLGKKAIINSSPLFFSGFYVPFIALMLFPIAFKKSNNIKQIFKKPGALIMLGVLTGLTSIFDFIGISMIDAAYLISVKRVGILVSTILTYFVFKEDHIREHLIGAGLMVVGVAVIFIFG